MIRPSITLLFGISAAVAIACGQADSSTFDSGPIGPTEAGANTNQFDDGGAGDASVTSLEFVPPSQTLVLDGTTAKTATYKLVAHLSNGNTLDVKAQSISFDRPDLAAMSGFGPVS